MLQYGYQSDEWTARSIFLNIIRKREKQKQKKTLPAGWHAKILISFSSLSSDRFPVARNLVFIFSTTYIIECFLSRLLFSRLNQSSVRSNGGQISTESKHEQLPPLAKKLNPNFSSFCKGGDKGVDLMEDIQNFWYMLQVIIWFYNTLKLPPTKSCQNKCLRVQHTRSDKNQGKLI